MTYVVTKPCYDCKYTDCVTLCPTEAFYQDDKMLYINPDECICCGACVPECPIEAIYEDCEVPGKWQSFIALNAERSAALKESGGHITERQEPLEGPSCKKAE